MGNINYDGRVFRAVETSDTGEVDSQTTFFYKQNGNIVTAEYRGGDILSGHLIATCDDRGELQMRYHHVNRSGDLMTGICHTVPEILPDGRLRLHETWQWTSGSLASGTSILEEVR
jgi:hypothetical protein